MKPSQRPTCTGLRVRSTRDANIIFHAVTCGMLPMVSRRLDAADRAALRTGCVYVWEERSPASDATGAGMERFTEGRHWHPSRVRDDFLLYLEKDWDTPESQIAEKNQMLRRHQDSDPSTSYRNTNGEYPIQPARRLPMIKQTYSVWVNIGNGLKKWHMNAYYTEDSLEQLHTVEDIPVLSNLVVPHECYQRARSSTSSSTRARDRGSGREAAPGDMPRSRMPRRNSAASVNSQASDREHHPHPLGLSPLSIHHRTYAAFPSGVPPPPPQLAGSSPEHSLCGGHTHRPMPAFVPSHGQSMGVFHRSPVHTHFSPPSPSPSSASSSLHSSLPSPAPDHYQHQSQITSPGCGGGEGPLSFSTALSGAENKRFQLVPLERLASHRILRREPADDEILRSFRSL